MAGSSIASVNALEILDSRGNPTVRVNVILEDGTFGVASVPSGASTGEHEAHELRDGDKRRYGGKGVLRAVENVEKIIGPKIAGMNASAQADIDHAMIALDSTKEKSRLGANAILGVSMACARAAARADHKPLYAYLATEDAVRLPVPMMNVINGGLHADNRLDFQEFMIVPRGATSFAEALRFGAETFQSLRKLLKQRGQSVSVGDEGGFAPNLASNDEACEIIGEAIVAAGYDTYDDIALALDPAATSFAKGNAYDLVKSGGGERSSADLLKLYDEWVDQYPIVSIEDGFGENDWDAFIAQTAHLGSRIQIVGDDLYVTNPDFIKRGIRQKATNAVLIKLNQIGTVTETIEAVELCRNAGWRYVISHRSGETEDPFIADFAVAMGGAQIKTGSLCRSERIAKYNRLLEIERELGTRAVFESPI